VNLNSLKVAGTGGLQFLACLTLGEGDVRSLDVLLSTTTTLLSKWPRNVENLLLDFDQTSFFDPLTLPALPSTVKQLTVLNGDQDTRLRSSTAEVVLTELDLVNDYGEAGCTDWPFTQRVSADSATMTLSVLSTIGNACFKDLLVYSEGEDVLPFYMDGFRCLRFTLRGHRFMSSKETMRFLRAVPCQEIVLESCTYRDDMDLEAHLTTQKKFSFDDVKRGFQVQVCSHKEVNEEVGYSLDGFLSYPSVKRRRIYDVDDDTSDGREIDYPSSSDSDSDFFSDGEMM
jgi:hypothetical protein